MTFSYRFWAPSTSDVNSWYPSPPVDSMTTIVHVILQDLTMNSTERVSVLYAGSMTLKMATREELDCEDVVCGTAARNLTNVSVHMRAD